MKIHKLLAYALLTAGILFGAVVLFCAGYLQTHDLIRSGVSAIVLTMVVCGITALVFHKSKPDILAPAEYGDDDTDDDN